MSGPAYMKSWLDAIEGDEKFVMTACFGLINAGLLVLHYIDQGTYGLMMSGSVIAYIGGKVYENVQSERSAERVTIANKGNPNVTTS